MNAVVASYEEVVAEETRSSAEAATESLQNSKLELQVRIAETEAALAEYPDSAALCSTTQCPTHAAIGAGRPDRADCREQRPLRLRRPPLRRSTRCNSDCPSTCAERRNRPRPRSHRRRCVGVVARRAARSGRVTPDPRCGARRAAPRRCSRSTPRVKAKGPAPTVTDPNSTAAEAYHFIVSSLNLALAQVDGSTVVVTSTGAGDGKTVTALNLAVAAAGNGRTATPYRRRCPHARSHQDLQPRRDSGFDERLNQWWQCE